MKYADAVGTITSIVEYLETITEAQRLRGQLLGARDSERMKNAALRVREYIVENLPGAP